MKTSGQMTYDQACKRLGLSPGNHSVEEIREAFCRTTTQWNTALAIAMTFDDINRITGVTKELPEAHQILMDRAKKRAAPYSSTAASVPIPHQRTVHPRKSRSSAYGSFFRTLFAVCRAIPVAVMNLVESSRVSIGAIESHGIPRAAIVLGLLFGLLLMVHGCSIVKTPN